MAVQPSIGETVNPQRDTVAPVSPRVGLLQAVGRHKWIMLSTIAATTLIAASLYTRQIPQFVSSSRLLFVQSPRSDDSNGFGSAAFVGYLRAQAAMLNSGPVLDLASANLRGMHLASLAKSTDIPNSIGEEIQVSPDIDSGVITVRCQTPVASDSATIVNSVVDAYQDYALQILHKSDQSTIQFLQVEKDKHDALLSAANKELTEFRAAHPDVVFADGNGPNINLLKLAKLTDELTDAQANLQSLNAKYIAAEGKIPSAPPQTAGADIPASGDELDSDASWLQSELQRTTANIQAMDARGLPQSNPAVAKARGYETHLRQKLSDCQRATAVAQLNEIKSQLDLARQRESALQTAVDSQKAAAATVNSLIAEQSRLLDEVKRAQKSGEEVESRLKAISTITDPLPEARILERARPAQSPRSTAWPFIGIAAAAGLLLGSSFSYTIELLDTRIRTPGEAGWILGLPVLGILPQQRGDPSVDVLGMSAHTDSMSPLADGARRVRAAIFAASRTTSALTIVVTSPTAGDGKSVVAANLAIVMAQAGVRTLLIDANFQSPGTAKIFDLQRSAGLSDVISGKVPLDRAIRRTPVERLEVLSAGGSGQAVADFLNDNAFAKLIKKISESYQSIILDSPSIMSGPEARILGSNSDLTLMVVRTGVTDRKDADQAMNKLLSVGTRVLGTVVNGYSGGSSGSIARGGFVSVGLSPAEPSASDSDRSIFATKKSQSTFDQQVDVFD